MTITDQKISGSVIIDRNNLYREESFTDLKAGTIKKFVPIKSDGSPDPTRSPSFMGIAQIMSNVGLLPIQFMLEAKTLDEAIAEFSEAAKKAVDELIEEARRIQLESASRIIVPGQDIKNKLIL